MHWKKEIARDLIALGSIPFYFIVIIRAIIGQYEPFVYHLILALIIYHVLATFLTTTEHYIARSLILLIFIASFYQATFFTIFAILLWLTIIWAQHTRKVKHKTILHGMLLGALSSGLSYIVTLYLL